MLQVALAVDVGGTKLAAGRVDGDGVLTGQRVVPTPAAATAAELWDVLAGLITDVRRGDERVVGVGCGGPMEPGGVTVSPLNVPAWRSFPLRDRLGALTGLPVFIDNDANLAALAEHRFGAAKGTTNALMLTIGTGIGGGVIVNGELYRGSSGAGAELGHVVIDQAGPPCQGNCPNRGCVEVLASGTALGREGRLAAETHPDSALGRALAAGEEVDGRLVTQAALAGDGIAVEAIATIGRRLGVALSSLANIFEPEVIVIGGGVSAAGELLLEPAREELRSRALPPMNETTVAVAALGPDAGMVGAAVMALEGVKA
jgi:glucokinase